MVRCNKSVRSALQSDLRYNDLWMDGYKNEESGEKEAGRRKEEEEEERRQEKEDGRKHTKLKEKSEASPQILSIKAVRKVKKVVKKWRQMKKHFENTSGHDSKTEDQKGIKQTCFHHR